MHRCLGCMEEYQDEFHMCPLCGYEEGTPPKEPYHMLPGTILSGKYLVGKVLGFGGFGVTYIGYDTKLERKVAIKEYLPGEYSTRMPGTTEVLTHDEEKSKQFQKGLSKFVEEAKILAKMQDCNGVVKIYDSFMENSTAYIVMEYMEGMELAEYLKEKGRLSVEEAKEILHPVLIALKEIHAQGIMHRDIAPNNIYLLNDGRVKLYDFGASRYVSSSHSKSLSVIVKPGFAPAEQYSSRGEQGPWTDVYSLAATFYNMITGIVPEDALDRIEKEELQKPSKLGVNIKKSEENALMNALNIKAEDRTRDIETLEKELYHDDKVKLHFVHLKKADVGKWPLWTKLLVTAALLAVSVFAGLLVTGVIDYSYIVPEFVELPEGKTRVPNLVNQDLTTAETLMAEAKLIVQIIDKQNSEYIPEGKVLTQSVSKGKIVSDNDIVEIVISAGREIVYMCNVVGLTRDEALDKLFELGLSADLQEEYSSYASGVVMAQSVAAGGELFRGDHVTVTVSKGVDGYLDVTQEVEIPDMTGLTMEAALKLAETYGLYVHNGGTRAGTGKAGTVAVQSPEAGTMAKQGDTIELIIYAEQTLIRMPDVQYKEEAEAVNTLQTLGLKVTVEYEESSSVAKGRVIRQSVGAKEEVKEGTQVTLTVSLGTKEINERVEASGSQNQPTPTPEPTKQPEQTKQPGQTGQPTPTPEPTKQPEQTSQPTPTPEPIVYTWSDWVETLPADVDKSKYEIETKQQYRFRDKTTMSSANASEDGWTLYDTTTTKGGYGNWSSWSAEKPADKADREIESKKQYAYSDYQTATQNDNKNMAGWTLDASKTKTFYNNDYGNWSAWSTTAVSKNDNRNVETRDVTEYRYQTCDWKTQTNNSTAPSGYTEDNSRTKVAYGEWSAETETPGAASATLEVSAPVSREVQVGSKTLYHYYHYRYYYSGEGKYYYTWSANMGGTFYSYTFDYPLPYKDTADTYYPYYYSQDANRQAGVAWDAIWFLSSTEEQPIMATKTFYRTRTITTTYSFYKWSGWSGWSRQAVAGDANKRVETQSVREYRYQDRPTHYTYTFYRWTPYSAFGDTYIEKSATRQVKEQTIYRYHDKQDVVTYHYYKWGGWSEWRDEKVDSTETREVDAPRTMYRYKQK